MKLPGLKCVSSTDEWKAAMSVMSSLMFPVARGNHTRFREKRKSGWMGSKRIFGLKVRVRARTVAHGGCSPAASAGLDDTSALQLRGAAGVRKCRMMDDCGREARTCWQTSLSGRFAA